MRHLAVEIKRAVMQASLVDRASPNDYQDDNDALMAFATLRAAFHTVEPILAQARLEDGGAIDPVALYRASGYRAEVAAKR